MPHGEKDDKDKAPGTSGGPSKESDGPKGGGTPARTGAEKPPNQGGATTPGSEKPSATGGASSAARRLAVITGHLGTGPSAPPPTGRQDASGGGPAIRPPLSGSSDLDATHDAAHATAERESAGAGPQQRAAVEQVLESAVHAEVQLEAGLRIFDPVFGVSASAAYKAAVAAAKAEKDAATREEKQLNLKAFVQARQLAQTHAVDIMRNPALDIATRKSQLTAMLVGFRAAVRTPLDPSQFGFADAAHNVEALQGKYFDDMLTVDDQGQLIQRGKPAGTLSELMARVMTTNATMRGQRAAQEFVVSVSTPKDPSTPKEVKILRRPRTEVPADVVQQHAPVEPSGTRTGTTVDIGTGTSDFAREVGGEKGPLVKTEYGPGYTDPAMIRRDLTWQNTGNRTDIDSVLVLGDSLQTLPMMFPPNSVKRLFINNINAHYKPGGPEYAQLAFGLREVMAPGGRVEVQWTMQPEYPGRPGAKPGDRGHVQGDHLLAAFDATADRVPRAVTPIVRPPIKDYQYSIEATRAQGGATKSAEIPTDPTPEYRWVFLLGERPTAAKL